MQVMTPLAAFQLLMITLACGIVLDTRKEHGWVKYTLWVLAGLFALTGLFAGSVGEAFPVALDAMQTLGADPVSWLVVLVAIYFVTRPSWKLNEAENVEGTDSSERLIALEQNDQDQNDAINKLTEIKNTIIDDYQNVLGKQALAAEQFDKFKESMREHFTRIDMRGDVIEGKITDANTAFEDEKKRVLEAGCAISARETMISAAADIEFDVDLLYSRLQGGESYDAQAWQQWESVHSHWETTLTKWTDVGRWYAQNVHVRMFNVADKEYDAAWNVRDDQFPNADAVRRFKRHRIINSHWDALKGEVLMGAHSVAFQGMRERDMHRGKYHQTG